MRDLGTAKWSGPQKNNQSAPGPYPSTTVNATPSQMNTDFYEDHLRTGAWDETLCVPEYKGAFKAPARYYGQYTMTIPSTNVHCSKTTTVDYRGQVVAPSTPFTCNDTTSYDAATGLGPRYAGPTTTIRFEMWCRAGSRPWYDYQHDDSHTFDEQECGSPIDDPDPDSWSCVRTTTPRIDTVYNSLNNQPLNQRYGVPDDGTPISLTLEQVRIAGSKVTGFKGKQSKFIMEAGSSPAEAGLPETGGAATQPFLTRKWDPATPNTHADPDTTTTGSNGAVWSWLPAKTATGNTGFWTGWDLRVFKASTNLSSPLKFHVRHQFTASFTDDGEVQIENIYTDGTPPQIRTTTGVTHVEEVYCDMPSHQVVSLRARNSTK